MVGVHLAFDHLGGQVVERAAERLASVRRRVHAPAKIGDLELPVEAEQNVFGLDVAVNHMFAVEVV